MPKPESLFTPAEHWEWQRRLAEANRHNVFCHCRHCNHEWVASEPMPCTECGTKDVEFILCWQFPDG